MKNLFYTRLGCCAGRGGGQNSRGLWRPVQRAVMAAVLICLPLWTQAQITWSSDQNITNGAEFNQNITVTGNVTLYLPAGGSCTINGNISGTGSLTLSEKNIGSTSAVTYTMNGTNSLASGVGVLGRTVLEVGVSCNPGNIITTIPSPLTGGNPVVKFWTPGPNTTKTYNGKISGTGDVVIDGVTGTLVFTNDHTYTGATLFGEWGIGPTLQLGSEGSAGGSIDGTSRIAGEPGFGTIAFYCGAGTDKWFNKPIGKNVMINKLGPGIQRLRANNTSTSGTVVSGGSLVIGNGGTSGWIAGDVTVNKGAVLDFERSDDVIFPGEISGEGGIGKYGAGRLTLTAWNRYTGETSVYSGALQVGNYAGGGIGPTSAINISAVASLDFRNDDAITGYNQPIYGEGTLSFHTNSGAGSLTLGANSPFTGTLHIMNGKVHLGNGGATGSVNGNIVNDGELHISRSTEVDIPGVISGSGSLWVENAFCVNLTGENTYTGSTQITNAHLRVGKDDHGLGGSINGTSHINGNGNYSEIIFDPKDVTADGGADLVFGKVISGNLKLTKRGKGLLALTNNNTYTGGTVISGGGLEIGNNGTTGMIRGNIENNGVLAFHRSNDITYSGVISGTGMVTKAGAGDLTLYGNHTYTGRTDIFGGTLNLRGTIEKSSGLYFTRGGTSVVLPGNRTVRRLGSAFADTRIDNGGYTLTVGTAGQPDGDGQFAGTISGSGRLVKRGVGAGTALSLGDCDFTGPITVHEGQLDFLGSIATAAIANSGAIVFLQPKSYTYGGVISGTGSVHPFSAGGTLTLSGANTYTGETGIRHGGSLALGSTGSIAASSRVNVDDNCTFNVTAGDKTVKALYVTAGGTVSLGTRTLTIGTAGQADGDGTVAGKFTGSNGKVTKTGTGALTLSGASTATGTFTLLNGTLNTANGTVWGGIFSQAAGTVWNVTGQMTANGALQLNGGAIGMDLTGTAKSKIVAGGAATVQGVNTLNITTGPASGLTLIDAAGNGLTDATKFKAVLPAGYSGELSSTGRYLQLTATAVSKGVTVGLQNGTLTAGKAGTVTFRVTTANIANDTYPATAAGFPAGVSVQGNVTINNSAGTLTLAGTAGVAAGTHQTLRVSIDGVQSGAFTLTVSGAVLSGTVAITGNAAFGQTLSAKTDGLTSTPSGVALGTLTYQWKRGGANIAGATAATYKPVQADIGAALTVTVSAANVSGSVTSAATAPVAKAAQTAPSAPAVSAKTHNSVTLSAITGAEYRRDGGAWQTSATFTGLTAQTAYSFTARRAETATHLASPASAATAATTAAPPATFVPVTGITDVPSTATAGTPLTLTATVAPAGASNTAITWSIASAGTTGAAITGDNVLTAATAGTVTVKATIVNGLTATTDFVKEFTVTVTATQDDKAVSAGAQTGTLTAGAAGEVTFPVTTVNIINGSYAATVTGLPEGVTAPEQITVADNAATLTLTGSAATAAGASSLTLAIDGATSAAFTLTIAEAATTGTGELFAPELKVYPNPFTDVLHLTGISAETWSAASLQVINAAGAVVHTQKITSPDETIHLEHLPAGVYFFRIEKDGLTKTVKAIKN